MPALEVVISAPVCRVLRTEPAGVPILVAQPYVEAVDVPGLHRHQAGCEPALPSSLLPSPS